MHKRTAQKIERVLQLRKEADHARTKATDATRKLCAALREDRYSVLQIGELLGISVVTVYKHLDRS